MQIPRLKLLYQHDPMMLLTLTGGGVGAILVSLTQFFQLYVFSDFVFLKYLLIFIGLDVLFGVRKALKSKTFALTDLFKKTGNKILNYGALLIVVHVLTHFKVNGETNTVLSWTDVVVYSALMSYEALSIVKKLGHDVRKLLPKTFIEGLSKNTNVETKEDGK
jgi:hypothetical protein